MCEKLAFRASMLSFGKTQTLSQLCNKPANFAIKTANKGIDRLKKRDYNNIYTVIGGIKMTFEQAFKRIKTKFENVDASKLQDMALQITLSDEDCGGTFYAAVRNGEMAVEPYDYKDNDAVIDVTRASLTAILSGKASIDKEIEKGNLTVKGDLEKVASVKSAIKIPEKKEAAKKTVKKSVAKKSAAKNEKPVKVAPSKTEKTEKAKKAVKAETKVTPPKSK